MDPVDLMDLEDLADLVDHLLLYLKVLLRSCFLLASDRLDLTTDLLVKANRSGKQVLESWKSGSGPRPRT